MKKIRVTKIDVLQNRIVVFVECAGSKKYTDPQMAQKILSCFPNLAKHKCKNSRGHCFIDVIENTSLPHLFEHLVIDIHIDGLPKTAPKVDIFGFSEWLDESAGTARCEFSYTDDLLALSAINKAVDFINSELD